VDKEAQWLNEKEKLLQDTEILKKAYEEEIDRSRVAWEAEKQKLLLQNEESQKQFLSLIENERGSNLSVHQEFVNSQRKIEDLEAKIAQRDAKLLEVEKLREMDSKIMLDNVRKYQDEQEKSRNLESNLQTAKQDLEQQSTQNAALKEELLKSGDKLTQAEEKLKQTAAEYESFKIQTNRKLEEDRGLMDDLKDKNHKMDEIFRSVRNMIGEISLAPGP